MRYNSVIEKRVTTKPTVWPVTIEQVKRHLNMLFDSDGSFQFDDDDTYLTGLIAICTTAVGEYTGLSLAPQSRKAIIRNECGGTEIPFGPVTNTPTFKDDAGTALSNIVVKGDQFKWIETCSCYLDVTYEAGYTAADIPDDLVQAILSLIAWAYNHRGEEINAVNSVEAMTWAAPHSRKSFVA